MTTIEELIPDYFELVARWLSKAEINRWLMGEWRDRVVNPTLVAMAVRNRKNRLFLVRYNGQPCGLIALADIDMADKTAMMWYVLGEQTLSGRGITSDAVGQLARLSFGPASLGPVRQSGEFVSGHSQISKPRRATQDVSVPPLSFPNLLSAFRNPQSAIVNPPNRQILSRLDA